MFLDVVDVHVIDSLWPTLGIPAAVGFVASVVGAVVGGRFVSRAAQKSQSSAALLAAKEQAHQRELAVEAQKQERFTNSSARLLEVLVTHGQLVSDALEPRELWNNAGVAIPFGSPDWWKIMRTQLAASHTAMFASLATTLPFVPDQVLRARLRGAAELAYEAWALLPKSEPEFRRASNETAAYFRWLRWNLVRALDGEPLPDDLPKPDLGRPMSAPRWLSPEGIPNYT